MLLHSSISHCQSCNNILKYKCANIESPHIKFSSKPPLPTKMALSLVSPCGHSQPEFRPRLVEGNQSADDNGSGKKLAFLWRVHGRAERALEFLGELHGVPQDVVAVEGVLGRWMAPAARTSGKATLGE